MGGAPARREARFALWGLLVAVPVIADRQPLPRRRRRRDSAPSTSRFLASRCRRASTTPVSVV
jgi:hypothetical protein